MATHSSVLAWRTLGTAEPGGLPSIGSHRFGLGVQNEAGQRLIEFCQENALVIANPSSNNTREDSAHGHHQMVNTKIRLTIFLAVKDEKLFTVFKNKTRS